MCVHCDWGCFAKMQDAMGSQEAFSFSSDQKEILAQLASLSNYKNSKVALGARKVTTDSDMYLLIY